MSLTGTIARCTAANRGWRGPAITQFGALPTGGAEQALYAHIAPSGVYTTRHFGCAWGYPQLLQNPVLNSRGLISGELAAEDCPRAVRLVLQFEPTGPPFTP